MSFFNGDYRKKPEQSLGGISREVRNETPSDCLRFSV